MNALAIIPARGGSKRIPRKNIRLFCDKPIIAYSIEAAIHSGCFSEVMVSTDDHEIADVAQQFGAHVPFLRSQNTANDHATLFDVAEEVIGQYLMLNETFTSFCCILPTAPFIIPSDIQNSYKLLSDSSAVFSAIRFDYPIWRAFVEKDGAATMIWPEHLRTRSQDLQETFHDAGLFYWLKADSFLAEKTFFPTATKLYQIPDIRAQDIDTHDDWEMAEFKYTWLKKAKGT